MAKRAQPRTRKVHCNRCGPDTNHLVLKDHVTRWQHDEYDIQGSTHYEMLKCGGCDSVILYKREWCTEDDPRDPSEEILYPPPMFRPTPKWLWELARDLPASEAFVHELLKEIYVALQNDQLALAIMGIRSLLEQIMIAKVGDHRTFGENIAAFEKAGHVSALQRERLEIMLEAGHAAIHRGYTPAKEDLVTIIDLTEYIVQTIYLHDPRLKELRTKIPPKPIRTGATKDDPAVLIGASPAVEKPPDAPPGNASVK